jgi:hypothetical protein
VRGQVPESLLPPGTTLRVAADAGADRSTTRTLRTANVLIIPSAVDPRHTAATLLLAQDVDQRGVMEILGHSQISMTARCAHVLPEVMTDAAGRIGWALWGSPDSPGTPIATRPAARRPGGSAKHKHLPRRFAGAQSCGLQVCRR